MPPESKPADQFDPIAAALASIFGPEDEDRGIRREIEALAADQARDDASPTILVDPGTSVRARSETDLGISIDSIDPRAGSGSRRTARGRWARVSWKALAPADLGFWVFIVGIGPWTAEPRGKCPVCGGGALRDSTYCIRCDRTGADGKLPLDRWPGLRPGERLEKVDDTLRQYLVHPSYVAPERGGRSYRRRKPAG